MSLLTANNIEKAYMDSQSPLPVLRDVNLSLNVGEAIGIFGASGSGKSTLLHILGGLDSPDKGSVHFQNENIFGWNEKQRAGFRNKQLGFVFQFYHLLAEFSALENVMVPLLIAGEKRKIAEERAHASLTEVGLKERSNHRPAQLSGGEQQRVAIARAIVLRPSILLADEPTGNLDQKNGDEIWNYLCELQRTHGMAMVVVSHNPNLISSLPRKYELIDGKLK